MFGEDGEKGNCVTKTLQELIDMKWITYHLDGNHGGDYPRADEFVEAGIPYISANCIVGDRIDMKLAKYVTAERAKRFRKGIAENGDVLFAHNATVGPVAILETEEPTVILGTSLTSYRCNSNHILAEYLMAYMKNPLFVQQYERNMQQSTRKQVPITTQRKYSFIIPSMDEQKEFAHFVKQSDKSKFVRFKSQFIEMFGELGKDDKGWGLTTLGECCELNPKRPRNINDELLVSFVPMPAVSEDGKIDCSDIKPYKEVRKGFTYFAENDVLFAKITPCMENGKGAVAKGLEGGIGSGSTEFHVLRPIPGKSNPYWLYILTMFESFRVGARKVMTGTGGQLRVPIGYLNDYPISLPPIDLQERFEEIVHQSDKSKLKEEDHKSGMHEL